MLLIAGIMVAHTACFVTSIVMIGGQAQYIDEVSHSVTGYPPGDG
jgi:hypothetical protein